MQDAFGTMYRITTRSRELLQAWFDEWLPRLYPADAPEQLGDPLIVRVYPAPVTPGAMEYDWSTDTRWIGQSFTIPRDPALALTALDARRAWIEEQP